jgi:3-hydroxyisobutyrate dehydrogenase-like beta-hydroxyacid dehydrogenase
MTQAQEERTTSIGFIGLGGMGSAMVRRLLESGYDVVVWNRSKEPIAQVVDRGARPADDVAEVLQTGSVISILAHDDAFRSIFTPAVLADAPAGCVHANMATVSVAAGEEFADVHRVAGVGYLAAPVLGRPPVAAAGQLNVLVGGESAHFESIRGPLDALAKRIWHLGDSPAAANTAKIGVNYLIIHALQAMAESITLAERSGIDPTLFVELLSNTLFPGPVYSGYGAMMAESRYAPAGFTTTLGLKDLNLARAAAQSVGVALPTADLLAELFAAAVDAGADLDWASIAEVTRHKVTASHRSPAGGGDSG